MKMPIREWLQSFFRTFPEIEDFEAEALFREIFIRLKGLKGDVLVQECTIRALYQVDLKKAERLIYYLGRCWADPKVIKKILNEAIQNEFVDYKIGKQDKCFRYCREISQSRGENEMKRCFYSPFFSPPVNAKDMMEEINASDTVKVTASGVKRIKSPMKK